MNIDNQIEALRQASLRVYELQKTITNVSTYLSMSSDFLNLMFSSNFATQMCDELFTVTNLVDNIDEMRNQVIRDLRLEKQTTITYIPKKQAIMSLAPSVLESSITLNKVPLDKIFKSQPSLHQKPEALTKYHDQLYATTT